MIFRQMFDDASSTYSYLIASRRGAEALIIDPVLEKVDRYIKLLNELDLRLVKAVDTHLHADHITGLAELRDRRIRHRGHRGPRPGRPAAGPRGHRDLDEVVGAVPGPAVDDATPLRGDRRGAVAGPEEGTRDGRHRVRVVAGPHRSLQPSLQVHG